MKKNWYIIAYDISKNKARTKLSETLANYGLRKNKSVYECALSAKQLAIVKAAIEKLIDTKTDSVLLYPICKSCLGKSLSMPNNTKYRDDELLVSF